MPAPDTAIRHNFAGGFASDYGSMAEIEFEGSAVRIPYLVRCENFFFEANRSIHKIGGTSKYNATTIESGEEIRGLFEYVRMGTGGSQTIKKVVHAGTKVLKDDNDGAFTSIITGLVNNAVPNYTVCEDSLIIASDSGVDVPYKWDQTTAAVLGGSPPTFAFSVVHAGRLFAAGNPALPSRLYYSSLQNFDEWNGTGDSGSINVDPNDGDRITGIYPYRGGLVVFKGPNFGSIHFIAGLTPSTFSRTQFSRGVSCAWQNTIFPYANDLGFVAADGTIRSLSATEKFGDLEETHLSKAISSWVRDHVNPEQLRKAWAATDHGRGYVLFTLPIDGSSIPNQTLMMDFRFGEPWFSLWNATPGWSVARISDPNSRGRPILATGGNDGFVRKLQQIDRTVDTSTAISAYAKTPSHFGLGMQQHGTSELTFSLINPVATTSFDVNASTGAMLDSFELDVDVLAGDAYLTFWSDATGGPGQAREFAYEISNTELSQDVEVNAIHIVFESNQNPDYQNY